MDKKIRLAQIAPPWLPIPPRTYGGIELMLYNLINELNKREYEITLFASGDSQVSVDLEPITDKAIWLKKGVRNPHAAAIRLLTTVANRFSDFDLIHNHFNFFAFPLSFCPKCPPFLTTVHCPLDEEYAKTMKENADLYSRGVVNVLETI